ncbi:MAG TPA: SDR family oxidoreductase, partial [Ktedonobacteraceae bacterium]
LMEDNVKYRTFNTGPDSLDVTKPEQVEKWFDRHINQFGPIPRLLYAAGTKRLNFIEDLSPEDVQLTFDVNVFGFLNVVRALKRLQKSGRIVAITSEASITPMRTSVAYVASKAALHMAIKCMARELAPDWQIMGVMPTAVSDTEMTSKDIKDIAALRGWSEDVVAEQMSNNPFGRMIAPNEVAETIKWLMFDAPDVMSGSIVEIRAGN